MTVYILRFFTPTQAISSKKIFLPGKTVHYIRNVFHILSQKNMKLMILFVICFSNALFKTSFAFIDISKLFLKHFFVSLCDCTKTSIYYCNIVIPLKLYTQIEYSYKTKIFTACFTLRAICNNVDPTLIAAQRNFKAEYLQNDEENWTKKLMYFISAPSISRHI